ncbi:hypothetical protein Pcinc_011555 [Petrolisthes cinctipes]|uniref:Uncharacterized protein n=1 Tax=Petrolisthes cinctipes TaxID=88211 RepID=A0AAE1KUA5_PETCI|nr:hypothetical protein Pcinc_011555 [Petrolisthes cinctipes]
MSNLTLISCLLKRTSWAMLDIMAAGPSSRIFERTTFIIKGSPTLYNTLALCGSFRHSFNPVPGQGRELLVCEEYQYCSFTMITSSHWVFLFALLFCLARAGEGKHIPPPEELCGLIVDLHVQQECLECFNSAGEVDKNPEAVRKCVGSYLPPIVAECSVPHVENPGRAGGLRMHQGKPPVHHNHTNANLLPNCLARRMRQISRYLAKEMKFAKQAGNILKQVVISKLVENGGPTMLSAGAMTAILALPDVKSLVADNTAYKECLTRYSDTSRHLEHLEHTLALLQDDVLNREDNGWTSENEMENDDEWEREEKEEMSSIEEKEIDMRKSKLSKEKYQETRAAGNALPFGGTNQLARVSLLGTCIIRALDDGGQVAELLDIVLENTFFFPIPQWWVEPLLRVAKDLNVHTV